MNTVLRLGILGMSAGNGHPYSWSAICNGYETDEMSSCPFPVIPAYLAQQRFPDDQLSGVTVTHIWTQDDSISAHIARAARIDNIVSRYADMVGEVDAILLARDDAENHLAMALPFLEAGMPVYIDKPAALDLPTLDRLYAACVSPEQIFSCSALRYSNSLALDETSRRRIGDVAHVIGTVPKCWAKYGVHLIDPLLQNCELFGRNCSVRAQRIGELHIVSLRWENMSATLHCTGALPSDIRLRYFGTHGHEERVFADTYVSFRSALAAFVNGVRSGRSETSRQELETTVAILEQGSAVYG